MKHATSLRVILVAAALAPGALAAQYPLTPSPALDFTRLSVTPRLGGYGAVRETLRSDTSTFSVSRARITVEVQPLPIAALRLQADFAATGRTAGDTIPSFALTDAYVQLSPRESSYAYQRFRPALILGQFKTPFSLEYLTSFSLLRTVNRSQVADSVATRRDIGAMGEVRGWDRVVLAAAVVNGEGSNRPANTNGREMVVGRLTLLPPFVGSLAVSGKWSAHGADHRWGADARWLADPAWLPGSLVAEGELIRRAGPLSATARTDASGGYGLVAWRAIAWLDPVVKWERLRSARTTASGTSERRLRWTTYGINVHSPEPQERLRTQIDWIAKRERPATARNELVVQLILQF
jgi:hypothetical protein